MRREELFRYTDVIYLKWLAAYLLRIWGIWYQDMEHL
jgi:hypothetical protein